MRTRTRHTHPWTLAAVLVALNGPAAAADDEPADFLPLAVGNSWTFVHEVYDYYGGVFPNNNPGDRGEVTITVERTEVFGDTTYYVLSDLPPGWAPAPPHCPLGKKLRWKGGELMERTDTGERSFFRFEGPNAYTIPWTHGDDEVRRQGVGGHASQPVPVIHFLFEGHDAFDWVTEFEPELEGIPERTVSFLAGYGFSGCIEGLMGPDYEVYTNGLGCIRATLVETSGGGDGQRSPTTTTRTISYWDAVDGPPSATAPSTWGQVKGTSR